MMKRLHFGESFLKQEKTRLYHKEKNIPIYPWSIVLDSTEAISPASVCLPSFLLPGEQRNKVPESNHLGTHTHTQTNRHKRNWAKTHTHASARLGAFHLGRQSFGIRWGFFFCLWWATESGRWIKGAVEWVDLAGMWVGWHMPQRRPCVDTSHGHGTWINKDAPKGCTGPLQPIRGDTPGYT